MAESAISEEGTIPIPCFDSPRYEPYLALRYCKGFTPMYDERFYGYGKNKISYISHIRHFGYKFQLLKKAFLVHYPHTESTAKINWLDKTPKSLEELDASDLSHLSKEGKQKLEEDRQKELKELNQSQQQNEMNIMYSEFTRKLKEKYGKKPDCSLCFEYMDQSTTLRYKVNAWRERNFIDGKSHILNIESTHESEEEIITRDTKTMEDEAERLEREQKVELAKMVEKASFVAEKNNPRLGTHEEVVQEEVANNPATLAPADHTNTDNK